MADRRMELNPGEMFLVADRTILIDKYESILADLFKIGAAEHEVGYLFTFTGRINGTNGEQEDSVTVAMSPQDAWNFVGDVLNGLELLTKKRQDRTKE